MGTLYRKLGLVAGDGFYLEEVRQLAGGDDLCLGVKGQVNWLWHTSVLFCVVATKKHVTTICFWHACPVGVNGSMNKHEIIVPTVCGVPEIKTLALKTATEYMLYRPQGSP